MLEYGNEAVVLRANMGNVSGPMQKITLGEKPKAGAVVLVRLIALNAKLSHYCPSCARVSFITTQTITTFLSVMAAIFIHAADSGWSNRHRRYDPHYTVGDLAVVDNNMRRWSEIVCLLICVS